MTDSRSRSSTPIDRERADTGLSGPWLPYSHTPTIGSEV